MTHFTTLVAAREATSLDPATVARVREAVGGGEVRWLSAGEAADIACAGMPDLALVRTAIGRAAIGSGGIDAFGVAAAGRRRALLIADMDSTIVVGETLDELAEEVGLKERIAEITARSMNGELDFRTALRERVAMLRGLELGALERTWARMSLMPGARTLVRTMRAHGATTALVSGGFTFFTGRVAELCDFHYHRSNILLDDGQRLTGEVAEPILDRDAKLAELRALAAGRGLGTDAALAIGDGANDLAMIREAGLGIAYHAKPIVAAEATHKIDHADLRAALFVQGYHAEQFVA